MLSQSSRCSTASSTATATSGRRIHGSTLWPPGSYCQAQPEVSTATAPSLGYCQAWREVSTATALPIQLLPGAALLQPPRSATAMHGVKPALLSSTATAPFPCSFTQWLASLLLAPCLQQVYKPQSYVALVLWPTCQVVLYQVLHGPPSCTILSAVYTIVPLHLLGPKGTDG